MRINNPKSLVLRGRIPCDGGFSLIETIIFIIIVSVALAGVLAVMNFTTKHSADPLIRKQEIAIAESLLEEITSQNFTPGGFSGAATQANRPYFDDVGDYAGFTTIGIYPLDSSVLVPGLSAYSIAPVTVTTANLGPAANLVTNAKLITVTVSGPDGTSVSLSGYRTGYGN